MTYTKTSIQSFLQEVSPFDRLSSQGLERYLQNCNLLRYKMGQAIMVRNSLPPHVSIIYEGQVRLLGEDPRSKKPQSLKLLNPGEMLGWVSLIRAVPCETAIASQETLALNIPSQDFLNLLDAEPDFANGFGCSLIEVYELLGAEFVRRADGITDLKQLTLDIWPTCTVQTLAAGRQSLDLDAQYLWLLSGGADSNGSVGRQVELKETLQVNRGSTLRLVGLPEGALQSSSHPAAADLLPLDANGFTPLSATQGIVPVQDAPAEPSGPSLEEIPYAPEVQTEQPFVLEAEKRTQKYPYVRGRGPVDAPLACFQMLAQYWQLPFRKDVIRRILGNQMDRSGSISLTTCGGVAEMMGLKAQLVETPAAVFTRLPTPAIVNWQDSFAILYKCSPKELVFAVPEQGIRRKKPSNFLEDWGESGQVLLLEKTVETPEKKFGLSWFWPSVSRYRGVLFEVLFASFLVQLFALANPLGIQFIIDRVLIRNSADTLNVLGMGLLLVALLEALLTSFRTYLFADTTNRIDMTLGSQVIDHLVRLPLSYFNKRPVGELSTRVNELENIRQFLTGTALNVVLDSLFSVIYIFVMLFYSWLLTIIALATVPLFALLTIIVSPMIRQQVRVKAERNAETQSHLVEVVSGIQTVKAQNIELKSRWKWQERYARYVSEGFKAVTISTTAGSISSFLNKLSGLLLLWVGAGLVLQGELTLGELIAFRIIASYTTSPLLRLVQLWQNFQETALSLERLGDILDHPQEVTEEDRNNIPLPSIKGGVTFRDLNFGFTPNGPLQLQNINLEFPPGTFVGIAGESGSGKSTLMKLLMRLYVPNSGQILLDQYDVSKVELYSLRSQIGMVLQDSLLFDGSVQENIALPAPDSTSEEIVAAAKVAFAHDFIMELGQGYNTRVGERGSALSGGQRQRIAIARTVLQNPQMLILDEATSALDFNAERQVIQNLSEIFHDRTLFFITHRLKTLQVTDVIVMMDQGKVVEMGTHQDLMDLQGRYYWLYQQQETQG
ncbi:MAG: peptidase domain-containing ABC transporter [Thermosynechococcaceae cyanobacterium]